MLLFAFSNAGFLASGPGRARTILKDAHAGNALFTVLSSAFLGTVVGLMQMTPTHREQAFASFADLDGYPPS